MGNQQILINRRVSEWISSIDNTEEEERIIGNEFIEEWDNDFDMKRRILIDHFVHAYNLGLVKWPTKFTEEKS